MGSRYGGLKQMDPMGPDGETVLDYSVFDAIRAGFGKVVFIIREDFAEAFKRTVATRFAGEIEMDHVYQKLDDIPEGFSVPEGRERPWGTAHAIRAARDAVKEPFAVINADDFYGRDAYVRAAGFLKALSLADPSSGAMVGYPLANTLSDHGQVNRGICQVDEKGFLTGIEEYTSIARGTDGTISGEALDGNRREIGSETLVSMNFWAFHPGFFGQLEDAFVRFMEESGGTLKSECYIPTVIDGLISSGALGCQVLETTSPWFGVTYPDDKPIVMDSIRSLIASGEYPALLS